ncbi:hypothetical protein AB1Y20_008684 [Prymnesium parvum]|uniref:PS II complex 12 kDa extrinsic protein n=1 Tax=Prymnesium parvum TaxID=97485 RepID=A0AB34ITR8_PRYPA
MKPRLMACVLALATSQPVGALRTPYLSPRARLHQRAAGLLLRQASEKEGLLAVWEDVLDYLTNMGGYTGFTEEELKGGLGAAEPPGQISERLKEKDMQAFGRPTEGINSTTTTIFVILLILLGPGLMLLSIAVYGPPAFFP